jgi:hypothetical protein
MMLPRQPAEMKPGDPEQRITQVPKEWQRGRYLEYALHNQLEHEQAGERLRAQTREQRGRGNQHRDDEHIVVGAQTRAPGEVEPKVAQPGSPQFVALGTWRRIWARSEKTRYGIAMRINRPRVVDQLMGCRVAYRKPEAARKPGTAKRVSWPIQSSTAEAPASNDELRSEWIRTTVRTPTALMRSTSANRTERSAKLWVPNRSPGRCQRRGTDRLRRLASQDARALQRRQAAAGRRP